jgi:antitoxin component YwqK of YwqJK toxin-antitoxin module
LKKGIFLSILLCFILIQFGCENTIAPSVLENDTAIPNIVKSITDLKFKFQQDTLYYNHEKYDGYVFKEFQKGDTAIFTGYLNGLEEGVSKKWYPNKQLFEIREYHQGKKTGTHKGYWENGNKKFEYHFLNGEHNGSAKEWYENGQDYKFFHYKMGYEEGSQKAWWENGVIRANYVVKNGRRYGLIGLKLCMNPEDSVKIAKSKIK